MFGFAVVLLVVFAVLTAFPFSLFLLAKFTPPLDIIFVIREYADFACSQLSRARALVKSDEFLELFSRELAGHGKNPFTIPQSTTKTVRFLAWLGCQPSGLQMYRVPGEYTKYDFRTDPAAFIAFASELNCAEYANGL